MTLKKLITIKFVVTIVAYMCLAYFGSKISISYSKLEKHNKMLIEQKEIYEKILKLDSKKEEDKNKLYDLIKVRDSTFGAESKKNNFNIKTNILIFIIIIILIFNVFNFINTKIEKLKSEESESEREKML